MNKYGGLLTAIVAVALVAVSVHFQSGMKSLDNKMNMLLSQGSQQGSDNGGRKSDPYMKKAVRNTILKRAKDIQKAYNVYLEGNPEVTDGEVKLDWQIGPDGATISPEIIKSDFTDEAFQKNIIKAVSKWKFPPPPFGANKYIVHSFKLSKSK